MKYLLCLMWIVLLFINFFVFGVMQSSDDILGSSVSLLMVIFCSWRLYISLGPVVEDEK